MASDAAAISALVVGAGALGSVYAWRLQESGARVTVVCRSNYAAVRDSGFRIKSEAFGEHTYRPSRVVASVDEAVADGSRYSCVIVCTKALPNLGDPSGDIGAALASPQATVVLIQNGIGIEEPYRARYPRNPIASAVALIDVTQPAAGTIEHGSRTVLLAGLYRPEDARYDAAAGAATLGALSAAWCAGGIPCTVVDRVQGVRWAKLIWNASFNPISVLAGGVYAQTLLADADCRELVLAVMHEVRRIGEAVTGAPLPPLLDMDGPEAYVRVTESSPFPCTPSMLMDYRHRRPMEHAVILGRPLELAREFGVDAPRMQCVYAMLKLAEKQRLAGDQ
ncbi:hypothetical protein IWQ57_004408 [Coemansia nantahalensis]|uniref:Uncharacterized protein n=1 Tax=Coemansia nantahalensis TaxID=2789366 RepID=A0ACC1JSD2_9FUNG|nr:hypothetical protein IWQ57_004408 [Coemansia nantahalensis]